MSDQPNIDNPLRSLDDWEDFVEARYPEPGQKAKEDYRNYDNPARDTVREFYYRLKPLPPDVRLRAGEEEGVPRLQPTAR